MLIRSARELRKTLAGERLRPMISTYSLWFAWKKYRPDTIVHGEPTESGG